MTTTLLQPSIFIAKPFDQGLEELDRLNQVLISLPQNCRLRILTGPNSDESRNGNYTREGFIYRPKEKPLLVKRSPILYDPSGATNTHRRGQEFYPTNDQTERAIASGSYELPDESFNIPTNRFAEDPLTVLAFEDVAGEYGSFLREVGITEMPVLLVDRDYIDKQERPFARQLWFSRLDDWSGLGGYGRYLGCSYGVLGVPKETGEASPQKILEPTLEQRIKISLETGEPLEFNGELYNLNKIRRY